MAPLLPPTGTALELSITGLNHLGEGVGRWGAATEGGGERGVVVFVPQALPGEAVTARVTYQAKGHVVAELIERHNTAAERRRPPCILAERCGGCSVQHLVDEAQARWKQDLVQQALQRIGGFSLAVQPILAALDPMAARGDVCSPGASTTIRTARSWTSGENLLALLMAPSSRRLEPPQIPVRLRQHRAQGAGSLGWEATRRRS